MRLLAAKAPTFRQCSGVCCRVWVISPLSGPSHIDYAAWSGRCFMRESATSSKALNPSLIFSSIARNPWPDSFANSVTTSRSRLATELQHKTSRPTIEEVIFNGVAGTKLHLPVEEHLREGLQRVALLRLTASDQPPFSTAAGNRSGGAMRKIMLRARKNLYESAKPRLKTAPRPNETPFCPIRPPSCPMKSIRVRYRG